LSDTDKSLIQVTNEYMNMHYISPLLSSETGISQDNYEKEECVFSQPLV